MSASASRQHKRWVPAVVGVILVACVAWVALFLLRSGGDERSTLRVPDSELLLKASEIAAKLQDDERFARLAVRPNPEEAKGLIVFGRIGTGEDLVALDERVKQLAPGMKVVIRAEPAGDAPDGGDE